MGDTLSFIERWGRGTINIINECKTANIPEPNFYEEHGVVKIVFELTGINKFQNGGLNGGLNEGQKKVFLFIQKNKGIKAKDISIQLNMPINTIEKHIKVLINKNIIERRGSKKTGGYYTL